MKGKRYSKEFKKQIVKEAKETGNAHLVARKHDLVPGTVTRWVREDKKADGVKKTSDYSEYRTNKELEAENEKLKVMLGEKDLEIAILRDLLKKTTKYKR